MKEDVYTGGPIGFGYVLENINENNYLLEAPEEQELIKKMNKMRKDGMSYRKISDEINKEQYMKENEKSLSHQAISNILKDETKKKQKTKRVKDKIKQSKKK